VLPTQRGRCKFSCGWDLTPPAALDGVKEAHIDGPPAPDLTWAADTGAAHEASDLSSKVACRRCPVVSPTSCK
jgi:hypothetical protein